LFVAVSAATLPASARTQEGCAIKKCRIRGKWHYGDSADEECARSKVIELDMRGIQRKEIAARSPQPNSRRASRTRTRRAGAQTDRGATASRSAAARDLCLEDDIILTRDRKISDVEHRSAQPGNPEVAAYLVARCRHRPRGTGTGKQVLPQTAKTISNNETQIAKMNACRENEKGAGSQRTSIRLNWSVSAN